MHRPLLVRAAFAAATASTALPGLAQYQGIVSLPPVGPGDSRLLVGGATMIRPAYLGSDDHVLTVVPYVDYAHRNGFYASVTSGVGWSFVNGPATQVGVRLIPRFGRDQDNSSDLRGMGNIRPGVEGSVYWTQAVAPGWTVGLNLRGGDKGAEFDAGARRDWQWGAATRLSVTGFMTAADGRSQQVWHGVDAQQSLASGLPAFAPSAGLRNLQLAATVNHFFAGRWVAIGGLGLGSLVGDAADSPLTRQRTHLGGFIAIGYQAF